MRPEPSEQLRLRHLAHFEIEGEQAERALDLLGRLPAGPLLDLGCGMGRYLAAAAQRGLAAAGVDASLCQLVLARKLLGELGLSATLVAAEAERPPFAARTFAAVAAADLLEHVPDPEAVIARAGDLLAAHGKLYASTPNRFSLTPEPHVGVWGLGYLPRPWAERFVARRFDVDYRLIRPFSYRRLNGALRRSFPGRYEILLPRPGAREAESFSAVKRLLANAYSAALASRALRKALYLPAPYFQVLAEKSG